MLIRFIANSDRLQNAKMAHRDHLELSSKRSGHQQLKVPTSVGPGDEANRGFVENGVYDCGQMFSSTKEAICSGDRSVMARHPL